MKIYQDHKSRINGIVLIPQKGDLFTADMKHMLTEKFTFEDALASTTFRIMAKSRLKKLKAAIFTNLDIVFGSSENVSSNKEWLWWIIPNG